MSLRAGRLAAGPDHLVRHVGDLQHVLVGLGGQAAHEVELHLPPAVARTRSTTVRIRSSSDTILLITRRIRSEPPSGRERQPGAAAVAGQLVGQVDVERVDPGRRQRQRDVRALVPVGQALGDLGDLGVVGAGQRQQADLVEAGVRAGRRRPSRRSPVIDRSRTGRVIMPAWQNRQPRVQPRKISTRHRSCTVSASGTSGFFGYGHASRSIDGALVHPERHVRAGSARPAGSGRRAGSRRRRSAARRRRSVRASRSSSSSRPPGLPSAFQSRTIVGDLADGLLAVAEHGGVDEVGDRLRVERGVPAGDDDRVRRRSRSRGVQRDAGQVERGEQVGVAELGGERDAEQVERADRAVRVDGELRARRARASAPRGRARPRRCARPARRAAR